MDKLLVESSAEACDKESAGIHDQILATPLDIRDKKSGMIDMLTSGVETLGTTLSMLLYHLSKNPESQMLILEELNNGVGTGDRLSEATYTKACIQESYRMNPGGFVLARLLEENMELSGYQVPAGTFVLCHTMIASQDEANFTNAKQFIPERFVPNSAFASQSPKPNHTPSLVCPFGTGRRGCPGKRFSNQEILTVIIKVPKKIKSGLRMVLILFLLLQLVQNFEIEFLGEMDLVCDFLLGPRDVNIRFRDRVPV